MPGVNYVGGRAYLIVAVQPKPPSSMGRKRSIFSATTGSGITTER